MPEYSTTSVRGYFAAGVIDITFDTEDQAKADFDRWLRAVKAEAWDEGAVAAYATIVAKNPYRAEPTDG